MDGNSVEGSAASIWWDIIDSNQDNYREGISGKESMDYSFNDVFQTMKDNNIESMNEFFNEWDHGDKHELRKIYYNYGIDRNTPPSVSSPEPPSANEENYAYPSGWIYSPSCCGIEVSTTANDPDDGVVKNVTFEYSTDGGNSWTEIGTDEDGSDGWEVRWATGVTQEGVHVRARAYDEIERGTWEVDTSWNIDNDRPLPTENLKASVPTSGYTDQTDVTFSWDRPSDEGSGVQGYYYELDDDTPDNEITNPSQTSKSYSGLSDGEHTFYVTAYDGVQLEGAMRDRTIKIDTTPPTTTHDVDQQDGSAEVSLDATDDGSGVETTYYRIDGGSWQTYNGPFTLTTTGERTVEYYSEDSVGNEEQIQETTVTVSHDSQPPTADAGGSYYVDEGGSVNLDSSGSNDPDGNIRDKSWQVVTGSGYVFDGTYVAPDNVDSDADATVELTVTDNDDLSNSGTATVTVRDTEDNSGGGGGGGDNTPPDASFTYLPGSPEVDETITFDASGSSDPDGNIQSYEWNFGDGKTSTGKSPSHAYDGTGEYTVTLTVTDDNGGTDTATRMVPVGSQTETGMIVGEVTDTDGYPVTGAEVSLYTGSNDDPVDTDITSPDGNYSFSSLEPDTYTVEASYEGSVSIDIVSVGSGETESAKIALDLDDTGNKTPVADFSYSPSLPSVGDYIIFDASDSSDPDGVIQSYDWEFGDGTTATGVTPTHLYSTAGEYTVTLTVTDNDGLTHKITRTVSVDSSTSNSPPSAGFTYMPKGASASDSITFDASASSDPDGVIQSYDWEFGDGTTATGVTPTHLYSTAGKYTVTLTVTDNDGATDTMTRTTPIESDDDEGGRDGEGTVDDIQTSVSDTDGDGMSDRIKVVVKVSDVSTGHTRVDLTESEFDVDVSPTDMEDGDQEDFVSSEDPDKDGTPESVEFVGVAPGGGTVDGTYTVVAELSGHTAEETGVVEVDLVGGMSESETYVVDKDGAAGEGVSSDNPFGNTNNEPVGDIQAVRSLVSWSENGEMDGRSYGEIQLVRYLVEWNNARS
ncbi:PKD domain-containing protein [Haladaptatus sp. F3-133]|uniref:PKD domain-containing protein n=1 Tax=Halorutilus salinus TaxID=2487751 RepID=A0A9Q4GHH0_9EURY|nr:PKD domain-containing protein [Halorutilus salinus]MCX2817778.1 PKD domain-containing protein [Halorutilus salinus]